MDEGKKGMGVGSVFACDLFQRFFRVRRDPLGGQGRDNPLLI
jgi:hypothetical protein